MVSEDYMIVYTYLCPLFRVCRSNRVRLIRVQKRAGKDYEISTLTPTI
jgi:hypothetical protein